VVFFCPKRRVLDFDKIDSLKTPSPSGKKNKSYLLSSYGLFRFEYFFSTVNFSIIFSRGETVIKVPKALSKPMVPFFYVKFHFLMLDIDWVMV
jgi:hypothetical protein